jgi:hypothetical protein
MNIPLRAACDQSDLLREPGDAIADFAQRDLFEYFAPPLTEAGSPPLAADHLPPAASPNEVTAVGDEDVAWHDQILRRHEEIQDDAISRHEPQSPDEPDETAAYDRIASATRSEAAALDEASKADLSRLEATLSWLQSEVEACRLPPAPALPRVSGLPVVEPIFDRDALDRTPLQRTPPLPAWLREAPPAPQLAPPRSGGASWPGAIRFLVASAIAAPLSYYFAVATAPVHKRLAEIVGLASSDAPLAGPPELRDGWRMSMAAPQSVPTAQAPALASERIVEASASVDLPRADAAIRPSTDLPVAEAPAIPGPAVPAQAVQFESAKSETRRADPPRAETVRAQVITGPSATVVAEGEAPSAPPPAVRAPVPVTATTGPQDVKLLIDRGKQLFDAGDLTAARILFLRAANAGDAGAAVAMGATYDPVVLADRGYRPVAADLDKARGWYERAKEMGSPEGPRRLEMLANR